MVEKICMSGFGICLCLHDAEHSVGAFSCERLNLIIAMCICCSESMAAGAISVPTIVPLRAPHTGQHKTAVDTRTKIELHSGYCSVDNLHSIRYMQRSDKNQNDFEQTAIVSVLEEFKRKYELLGFIIILLAHN